MQNRSRRQVSLEFLLFLALAGVIVIADQLSKAWIRNHLLPGEVFLDYGVFQIVYVRNTGAAFGIFPNQSPLLAVVSLLGVIVILLAYFLLPRYLPFLNSLPPRLTLGIILGGTAGNLIDRFHFRYVTDFLGFTFWPAFNVADASVTVGTLVLAVWFLWRGFPRSGNE
ncbi:MAG: signal peptidase II [Chloroflexota bacterium]